MQTASLALPSAPTMLPSLSATKRADMERTAREFESVFFAQMFKPMWDGVETDPLFGGGHGEDVMRDFLVQEYGKAAARSNTSGLSDAVLNEMIRIQEQASHQVAG